MEDRKQKESREELRREPKPFRSHPGDLDLLVRPCLLMASQL